MASKEDKLKAKILKMGPAAAINAGLMKKKSGEVMGPGKIAAKVVSKLVGKAAAKSVTKSTTKALKAVNKPTDKQQKQ